MPGPSRRKGSCIVCDHVERARIEDMRGNGVSFDALADRFGVPKSTVARHWWSHVAPDRKASYALGPTTLEQARERAAAEGGSVVDHLAIVRSTLMRQLLRQDEADSPFGVATVAGRLLDVLRELGRISGEIVRTTAPAPSVTVNVGLSASPAFRDLMDGMLCIARAHPGARADIIALVDRLNGAAPALPPLIEHEANHAA